jgi:hypothetical protein
MVNAFFFQKESALKMMRMLLQHGARVDRVVPALQGRTLLEVRNSSRTSIVKRKIPF